MPIDRDREFFAKRLAAAARRLSVLIGANAPALIISNEKNLLDKIYLDWEKRSITPHDAPKKIQ